MKYHYFVLTGPTGIGKTKLSLRLADKLDLDILSIDSMLVYRGLDIGTAKPSADEMGQVKHHLVDVIEPDQNFDALQFIEMADEVYRNCGGKVLGTGGTPFYIQALRCGLPDYRVSQDIEVWLEKQESERLVRWLKRLDPVRCEKIHENDRFRLVRALSIALSAGKRPSKQTTLQEERPNCEMKIVAMEMDRDIMHRRLQERIEIMFKQGLLEEARALHEKRNLNRTAKQAVGYKELFAYFEGQMNLEEAKERILIATRQLLKHQMTWLRKMPVEWIRCDEKNEEKAWQQLWPIAEKHYANLK